RRAHRQLRASMISPPPPPADGAGDGVTEIAKIVVLQRGAGGVSANDSRDELNDQVDDRFHGAHLVPCRAMLLSTLPRSLHAFPAFRVLRVSDEALRIARSHRPHAWIDRPPTRSSITLF